MNDDELQRTLVRIWGPYCESFLDAPIANRLVIQLSTSSVTGRLSLTEDEWSRMDALAGDFQNRFDKAFTILCQRLDPRARGYVFDFFQSESGTSGLSLGGVSRLRAVGLVAGRRRSNRLALVADDPPPRSAAKLVKKKKAAPKKSAPKAAPKKAASKAAKAKATTKPRGAGAARKPVTKKPRGRRK